MLAHDLNAFSYCVDLAANKRNVPELATSSSHLSDSSIAFPQHMLSALRSWEMQSSATRAMGSSASSVETVAGTSASADNAGWSPQS